MDTDGGDAQQRRARGGQGPSSTLRRRRCSAAVPVLASCLHTRLCKPLTVTCDDIQTCFALGSRALAVGLHTQKHARVRMAGWHDTIMRLHGRRTHQMATQPTRHPCRLTGHCDAGDWLVPGQRLVSNGPRLPRYPPQLATPGHSARQLHRCTLATRPHGALT